MIGWWLWSCLLLTITAAAVWANSFYWWWSTRFSPKLRVLGAIAEWAFLLMITGLGMSGAAFLIIHHP